MRASDFRHMSPEDFELYRSSTEEEFEAYRNESAFRKWCKEFDEDPLDEAARESYEEYLNEYGPGRFDENETARRLDDMNKDQ